MSDRRLADLQSFYVLLDRLAKAVNGSRTLGACSRRSGWPQRGVYFFFENGEDRTHSGSGPRVVRVGTHALTDRSRTKLWTRLSQHRGQVGSGRGNHRGSIFRLIIGTALIKRRDQICPTWGEPLPAARDVREVDLEGMVSDVIRAMSFLWLAIDDEPGPGNRRGCIERNAIALLSNYNRSPLDPPSSDWLGHDCDRERVSKSGLWNSDYVDKDYDPAFLAEFEGLVGTMEAARRATGEQLSGR